ncbi:unnamed protein product [Danaus chrysippus]|uniref:(African queen) hypothetical protein n=1 Tax=Danaus chrysippus TaxID=151541 RepID=A0A8J2RC62_9NEOP|nr:unnamed protein product [Danaus chrysippus]
MRDVRTEQSGLRILIRPSLNVHITKSTHNRDDSEQGPRPLTLCTTLIQWVRDVSLVPAGTVQHSICIKSSPLTFTYDQSTALYYYRQYFNINILQCSVVASFMNQYVAGGYGLGPEGNLAAAAHYETEVGSGGRRVGGGRQGGRGRDSEIKPQVYKAFDHLEYVDAELCCKERL